MRFLLLALLASSLLLAGGLQPPAGRICAAADAPKEARKAFRTSLKSEKWQDRQEAYLALADYDGAEVARTVLDAMSKEPNPAVVLTAIDVLAGFESKEAQNALIAVLRKGKGASKTYVLIALARQPGKEAVPILIETLEKGKDEPAMAQAALALGSKEVEEAVPHLLKLLSHKAWQVRRAGAMALARIAQPPPPKPKADGTKPPPDFRWPVPEFMEAPEVTQALVASLASSKGRERGDILHALDAIHDKDYGYNVAAWKKVAAGEEPDAKDLRKRVYPPHAFGIPIYGQRVVLMLDNGLRSSDPHRFGSDKRMAELCEVPGGAPIFSARLRTVGEFARAHFKRCIADMPKGTKFEMLIYNERVAPTFGKFTNVSGASRKLVEDTFAGLEIDNAGAVYDALNTALDMGGTKESHAWKKGPDEIVFMICSMPTVGDIKDGDVIAAAISLKARMRMVPIHTIGIERHPYAMIDPIAKATGAVYRNYYE